MNFIKMTATRINSYSSVQNIESDLVVVEYVVLRGINLKKESI